MRVDALHRRIVDDARAMHTKLHKILPVQMPARYATRALNVNAFLKRLNAVTEPLGLFNERQNDKSMVPGTIYTSGLWLGFDELPENGSRADVRVIWHVHPTTKLILMTQPEWARRRYFFWQMFMHELVHRHQDVHRTPEQSIRIYRPKSTDRNLKEEQEYYGNFDEIEAHAHAAAIELLTWWGNLNYRDAVREACSYTGRLVTPTYCFYLATFADTPKHPAMEHFKRKLRTWYDVIAKDFGFYLELQLPNLVA